MIDYLYTEPLGRYSWRSGRIPVRSSEFHSRAEKQNMDLKGKRILITQPMMYSFIGSVVVTIELAEHLKKCGAAVEVYTYELAEPVKSELVKREIPVYSADKDPDLDLFAYDLIWIHSQTFPETMALQLSKASEDWEKAPYFIFLHMSSADFAPDEFPWIYRFEDTAADKVLYISEKAESTHRDLLEDEIPFAYFRNPAPVEYYAAEKTGRHDRVLIVSNHVPKEVKLAAAILRSGGVRVDYLGKTMGRHRLIRPEDIREYDAVVTIGKTVQYCILARTPVYIYDRFGGPGYLSEANYEESKQWHFSGRGFEKKSAEEIAREIRENREKAAEYIIRLQETEAELYRIDTALDRVLGDLTKREKHRISHAQELSLFYAQRLARYRFNESGKNERLRKYLSSVENSPTMKAGSIITFLPRKCREMLKNQPGKGIRKIAGRMRSAFRHKTICLVTCVYNEERNLPEYLRHIEPYVDCIVMLDDGSTDNTKAILRSSPKLRCLIERPEKTEIDTWSETSNREELLNKAKELGADWALALDPDERLEDRFLKDLRSIVESSNDDTVYGLRLRALWDSYDQFRIDGIWGNRTQFRLFPLNRDIAYRIDRKELHHHWYPDSLLGHETLLDYDLYHLKSILPEARAKRAALYNSLDPHKKYQSVGYDYLADEQGRKLQKILPGHRYDYTTVPAYIMNALSADKPDLS